MPLSRLSLPRRAAIPIALLTALFAPTAPAAAASDPLEGDWRGTSLCQVKPSPCRDEIALYHVSRLPAPGQYRLVMSKIVAGEEQVMGTTDGRYDAAARRLTATTHDRQNRPGLWTLILAGDRLSGRLVTQSVTYRLIELSRVK